MQELETQVKKLQLISQDLQSALYVSRALAIPSSCKRLQPEALIVDQPISNSSFIASVGPLAHPKQVRLNHLQAKVMQYERIILHLSKAGSLLSDYLGLDVD